MKKTKWLNAPDMNDGDAAKRACVVQIHFPAQETKYSEMLENDRIYFTTKGSCTIYLTLYMNLYGENRENNEINGS